MAARRRVTIRDVAQAAGVSTTTVSDALSGNGRLPAATRRRVAAVAGRLGYRANPAARSLRGQRVGGIGLYLPDEAGNFSYYLDLAAGAASQALAHGLALTLIPHSPDPSRLTAFPVDGFVAVDPVTGDPVVRAFAQLGIPVVTCERDLTPGAQHAGRVEGDYRPAMTALLDHLAEQGARRVALIAPGPETAWGLELRAAYQAWCAAGGRPELLFDVPFPGSPELVHDAAMRALRADPAADAVVSGIDGGALGALVAASEFGRRVPEDLLVASCVDSPALRICSPAITALDLVAGEMGRRLAGLLHGLLEGTIQSGTVQVVQPRLTIRASTSRLGDRSAPSLPALPPCPAASPPGPAAQPGPARQPTRPGSPPGPAAHPARQPTRPGPAPFHQYRWVEVPFAVVCGRLSGEKLLKYPR